MDTDRGCTLCPHHCKGIESNFGRCGVRRFQNKQWENPYFGRISALAADPVEKKPLYHFHPGSSVLSVGFWGCNMQCPFCQNWQISQQLNLQSRKLSPRELLNLLMSKGERQLAFTYNEPLIHFDYVLKAASLAREEGISTILVSNGMINPEMATRLLPFIDACNIDLKSFNGEIYRKKLGGSLSTVLKFIETAFENCHLEITTLVVPGISDNPLEMKQMTQWISAISREIPYHLSAYFPHYRYDREATSRELLVNMLDIAGGLLNWVYPGNSDLDSNSYCPDCGSLLILRRGYEIEIRGLDRNKCRCCKREIPLVL